MPQKILILGSGAREHAIGWKILQDNPKVKLFFAPGNGGTSKIGNNLDIDVNDTKRLLNFASENNIDLTIVGPERPLANGIVNAFQKKSLSIFGHTKEATILESDKAEAMLFMQRHRIPHPDFRIFTDSKEAEEFVRNPAWEKFVIKASGLADGKGVVLPGTEEDAILTIRKMMIEGEFGEAGKKIVIQERLIGKEVSVIGFVSNEIGLLVPAQDYKRIFDNDKGPNTGGMGAYAPNINITQKQLNEVYNFILLPTKLGMEQEGKPLCGVLYVGLMMTKNGPKVIEYNMRFGDPETQVQLRLLKSNLLQTMKNCIDGKLTQKDYKSSSDVAVGVVVASDGYPGKYEVGKEIIGNDKNFGKDVVIFHSGTKREDKKLVSSGGRVLTVTAIGKTRQEASKKIYNVIDEISMSGKFYRSDIGR
ncbi:MAG TPA: phosphoribosylamine--glycine ligase [Alphaproteobacteria bacterium]|jgi:phosphoribosylamine--glycine ligase|nr:phosphoribosylamine--glycine ligase [Alphaproteobacteria bacterium]